MSVEDDNLKTYIDLATIEIENKNEFQKVKKDRSENERCCKGISLVHLRMPILRDS